MKYLNIELYGETFKVKPYRCKYAANDSLAVILLDEEGEDFDTITVNLSNYSQSEDTAFVDTNNCSYVEKFLKRHKIAKPVGIHGQSGFCSYPLYKFDLSKLEELPEDY